MSQDQTEVYNRLSNEAPSSSNQKWTGYLIACCIVTSMASFVFGYNIGVINLPTPLVKEFYSKRYFNEFHDALRGYNAKEAAWQAGNKGIEALKTQIEMFKLKSANSSSSPDPNKIVYNNMTASELMVFIANKTAELAGGRKLLDAGKLKLDEGQVKVENGETILWTLTTSIFVVGGTIGALTSKYVAEFFGRKKGLLFHHIFVFVGAILSIIAPYINSPECVIVGRFLFGIQGGMACGLVPTYLNEISPSKLRGRTGVIHQLCLTCGILISQILGFRQLLGTAPYWNILIGLPIIPSLIGCILLFLIFPESPTLLVAKNEEEARKALKKLRNSKDVNNEIEEIRLLYSKDSSSSSSSVSIVELFTNSDFRWPLITGLVLQLAQQLCGINAIFFYSESIFLSAKIEPLQIQYAVVLTGIVNVCSTLIVVPLIDKLGRKPLLVYPMALMIIDFIALTILLVFKEKSIILSYLSIVCIIIFILCFAVGLGPIPFIYVAECFRQEARSTALAVCMGTNWLANLVLTLTFPYIVKLLGSYTFLVFTVIVALALAVIVKKVPETKGRSIEEIEQELNPKAARRNAESNKKLMPDTNV